MGSLKNEPINYFDKKFKTFAQTIVCRNERYNDIYVYENILYHYTVSLLIMI